MEDKIKDRIAKLLAKAEKIVEDEHGETPESIATMEHAMRLMARHHLDEAEIRNRIGGDGTPPGIVKEEWMFRATASLGHARCGAITGVCDVFGCSVVSSSYEGSTHWGVTVYGTRDAVDMAIMTAKSLDTQWDQGAVRAWEDHLARQREARRYDPGYQFWSVDAPPVRPVWNPLSGPYDLYKPYLYDSYRPPQPVRLSPMQQDMEQMVRDTGFSPAQQDQLREQLGLPSAAAQRGMGPSEEDREKFLCSFITGYALRAIERLRAGHAEAVAQSPGAGLVLASDAQRADAQMKEDFPDLKKMGMQDTDPAGLTAGRSAGSGADLGGQRFGYAQERGPRGIGA